MTRVLAFRLTRPLIGFRAGFSLLGCQQGRTKKGQNDCLVLPCRIAAQQRSSCSSALLYPLLGIRDFTILFFVKGWAHFHNKMGPFSMIILMSLLSKWALFR